jgi:hypothetical protein
VAATTVRAIGLFAAPGIVGPVLVPFSLMLGVHSPLYDLLYILIAFLCPAWVLGPLEYTNGRLVTWLVILLTNVFIWSVFGAAVTLARRLRAAALTCSALLLLASAYAYGISALFVATLFLVGVIIELYVTTKQATDPAPPNSALLADAYSSPLRAQRGAAKRGR